MYISELTFNLLITLIISTFAQIYQKIQKKISHKIYMPLIMCHMSHVTCHLSQMPTATAKDLPILTPQLAGFP